jgi:hypothetical protein
MTRFASAVHARTNPHRPPVNFERHVVLAKTIHAILSMQAVIVMRPVRI